MAGGLTQPTEIKELNFSRLNQKVGGQIRREKDMLLRRPDVSAADQDFGLFAAWEGTEQREKEAVNLGRKINENRSHKH